MTNETAPIESVFAEIEKALAANLVYAAIMIALSVPDICATLEHDTPRANDKTYTTWIREWLHGGRETQIEKWYYKLRCGVLHNARGTHRDMQYSGANRWAFTLPGPLQVDGINFGGIYTLSSTEFCHRMIAAGRKWYEAKRDHPNVKANEDLIFRERPAGFLPMGGDMAPRVIA